MNARTERFARRSISSTPVGWVRLTRMRAEVPANSRMRARRAPVSKRVRRRRSLRATLDAPSLQGIEGEFDGLVSRERAASFRSRGELALVEPSADPHQRFVVASL